MHSPLVYCLAVKMPFEKPREQLHGVLAHFEKGSCNRFGTLVCCCEGVVL